MLLKSILHSLCRKITLAFCCWVGVAIVFFGLSGDVIAQRPFEVILLINDNAPDSREIGEYYAELRHIPTNHIVYLQLPQKVLGRYSRFTAEEFNLHILQPVEQALRDRHLTQHVRAWVYSTGFPTTIKSRPTLSLQGITFTRGVTPDIRPVAEGTFSSPYFRGPSRPDGILLPSLDLSHLEGASPQKMPIPSMMLGHTGGRGNTVNEVLSGLYRAARSDHSSPSSCPVYFQVGPNIRSVARMWQLQELNSRFTSVGVDLQTGRSLPSGKKAAWMGCMLGTAEFLLEDIPSLAPGAVADHLTSFAGFFSIHAQTKCSAWIQAGAAATSGTVVEPQAIWTKFPHLRFYEHYRLGCSILESYFQSIRSPMQILLLGDPLARPYALQHSFELKWEEQKENVSFSVFPNIEEGITWLLDGQLQSPIDQGHSSFELRLSDLSDGKHLLEAYVSDEGEIGHVTRQSVRFEWNGGEFTPLPDLVALKSDYKPDLVEVPFRSLNVETVSFKVALAKLPSGLVRLTRKGELRSRTKRELQVLEADLKTSLPLNFISSIFYIDSKHDAIKEGDTAMLAFNVESEERFMAFGLYGANSAWVFLNKIDGAVYFGETLGKPIRPRVSYHLAVQQEEGGLRGYVDGLPVAFFKQKKLASNAVGLVVGPSGQAVFKEMKYRKATF